MQYAIFMIHKLYIIKTNTKEWILVSTNIQHHSIAFSAVIGIRPVKYTVPAMSKYSIETFVNYRQTQINTENGHVHVIS